MLHHWLQLQHDMQGSAGTVPALAVHKEESLSKTPSDLKHTASEIIHPPTVHLVHFSQMFSENRQQEEQTEKSNLVSSEKYHCLAETSSFDPDGTAQVRKKAYWLWVITSPEFFPLYITCLCLLCMNFVWMLLLYFNDCQ